MRKLLKIFTYFIVVIFALAIVLTIIAKLAENKITDIVLKKVGESIEAPVIIDNVSFNLIRKFPLATIELNDVFLGVPKIPNDSDSLSIELDTIISISKIYISVKSKPLLNGDIEIMKVDIDGANINYIVDTSGATNIDFLINITEDDTLPTKPLNLTLTDFSARNIVCNFNDSSLRVAAKVILPKLKVKAKVKGENIFASAKGGIVLSNCSFGETNLHLMNKTDVDFNVDYEDDSLSIKQLIVNTDGAKLNLLGSVLLGDEIETDVTFEGSDLILGELIKYAPKEMLEEFGLQKVSGKMNLDAIVKGTVSDSELPQVDLTINFQNGSVATNNYPKLKNISFSGKITNGILRNNRSTQVDFSSFRFETEQSKFDVAFSVLDLDHPKYDIKTDMEINISEFADFIPDSLIQYIDGNIKASFSTKGELPDSIGDDFIDYVMANSRANIKLVNFNVDLDSSLSVKNFSSKLAYKPNSFKVSDLNISIPAYKIRLKNTSFDANLKGSINNTSEMILDLKSYHIETDSSEFNGSAWVTNFDNPSYKFTSNIKLNLDEVKTMLPDSLLTNLTGKVFADIKSSGTISLDSIVEQAMDIIFESSSFKLNFEDIFVEMPDNPLYKIEKFSGLVNMKPEAISINKMSGIVAGLDFKIDSTEIWNTYEVLIQEADNEILTIQTNIILGEINNSLIGAFMSSDTSSTDRNSQELSTQSSSNSTSGNIVNDSTISEPKYLFPNLKELGVPYFLICGKIAVNKLEYEKNIVDDISLKFRFTDSLYVVDQFKFKTCDGEFNTSLKLDARRWNKPVVDVRSYINNLDVKQLLMVNDNFGDTSLTYEKVSGILTSELHLRTFYVDGLWPTEKIRAKGHFTLENGSIYSYEPLVELSKNKIVGGLKELDELDFNTLKSSLFMYKDKIYIPKTDIVTSSMDITAFAMHSMQDDYEYHLELHLGDVLTGKSEDIMKKQAKQSKLNGETFDRSGGVKLVSSEIDGNKKNGFDNKKLRDKFKNKLNMQQGFLRFSFNPLLVNFSTELDRTKRNKELIEKYGRKD